MKAYECGITKKEFVKEMKMHAKMDAFIKGTYGESEDGIFKGCSVGCALHSVSRLKGTALDTGDHELFEKYLGVPEWLARLNDTLFENLPEERSKKWPVEFSEAINEGADLDKIKTPYLVYILTENLKTLDSLKVDKEHTQVIKAIEQTRAATLQVIKAHESDDKDELSAAESAARSAAESVAWAAAESAAESAAWAARSAAWSAAWSVAWSAAESAAFVPHADKLLEMIRECK